MHVRIMQHLKAQEMLESYTLGLIEEPELSDLEAHLDSCEACRAQVRELSALSAIMAESLPQHDPPDSVEESLMARVAGEDKHAKVGSSGWSHLGWLIASAAAVLAVYFGVQQTTTQKELAAARSDIATHRTEIDKLKADLAAYEDATLLLGQPGMQFVDLAGVAPNGQAFGKVVMDPDRGTGVVYMYELPQTPDGMEYQLWVMRDGHPTSAGTFTVAGDGSAVLSLQAVPDMSKIASFQVTIEPEGGEPSPTGMMYLTGPDMLQFNN